MKRVPIAEADVVVNVNDGSQSWSVSNVEVGSHNQTLVTLSNNDSNSSFFAQSGSEEDLESIGLRGYRK